MLTSRAQWAEGTHARRLRRSVRKNPSRRTGRIVRLAGHTRRTCVLKNFFRFSRLKRVWLESRPITVEHRYGQTQVWSSPFMCHEEVHV